MLSRGIADLPSFGGIQSSLSFARNGAWNQFRVCDGGFQCPGIPDLPWIRYQRVGLAWPLNRSNNAWW